MHALCSAPILEQGESIVRIVVFSDSHGNYTTLRGVVQAQPTAEVFLHLGDGQEEFQRLRQQFPEKQMLGVVGNCDWQGGQTPEDVSCLLVLGGKRVFFTHGHRYGVKRALDALLHAAKKLEADIVLYGHTHIAYSSYRDGMYVLNPGSLSYPKSGPPSYGFVDITSAGIVPRVVPLEQRRWR